MVGIPAPAFLYDPYKNFRFKVKWDSRYVAGVSKVGALGRSTEVIEHRVGGDQSTIRKSPGITRFEPITFERGVTQDADFSRWANKVWYLNAGTGSEVSLADFRKNINIEVYNEAGQKALSFTCYRCWVSDFRALSDLDSNANAVVFESITLQNEGWIQDYDYKPPEPPRYDVPPVA